MTDTCAPLTTRIDAALDELHRQRQLAQQEAPTVCRSLRIARLYEREAELWSALFEHTRVRVYWRAALGAEICARQSARRWRRQAACERGGPVAAGGVS